MKSIDVFILTGYLGAGKTTTLNNILKTPRFANRKIALVINEFGKMSIDGALVTPGNYDKYEINKGSLFCICTKTDFLRTMSDIVSKGNIEAVVIEATGIAEVGDIESILNEAILKDHFTVKANICIVDAVNFTKTAPFLKAVTSQVRAADGLIVNKTDLVEKECVTRLISVLQYINNRANIARSDHGQIENTFIDELEHQNCKEQLSLDPPQELAAMSFANNHLINRQRFEEAIDSLGVHLVRFKGNINFESGKKFIEIVFGKFTEKTPAEGLADSNTFTAIGWQVTREQLQNSFENIWTETGSKRKILDLTRHTKSEQTDTMKYFLFH